jgi:hypothetical protein
MKPFLLYLSVSFLFITQALSQDIISNLKEYNQQYLQEKVYVHFNKQNFYPGETIWFKAYLFSSDIPSSISSNFYTELIDENGKVIDKKMYPIFESTAAGDYDIPLNFPGKYLVFRAYTTWMLNLDTAFLFTKTLGLVTGEVPATTKTNTIVRFFPEGGDLVTGLESNIAFKAIDGNQYPRTVKGEIKNSKGKLITPIKTDHDGMGIFKLIPDEGENYYAEWTDEDGVTGKTNLPAAKQNGTLLQVTKNEKYILFTLKRSDKIPTHQKNVMVIAQMHQQLIYAAKVRMDQTEVISGNIPIDSLPTGIVQLTLLDEISNPVAERIIFINKDDYIFNTSLTWTEKNLNKRGKNVFELEIDDTLRTNFSISITDAEITNHTSDDNIISNLLLTSDLRGYIHNPYYYFSKNDSASLHLDLVMLTNGWRRYNWNDIAAAKYPVIRFPVEKNLTIKGKVLGVAPSQIPANTTIVSFIQAKDSSTQMLTIPVSSKGEFEVDGLVFFDTVKLFYQFNKNNRLNRKTDVVYNPEAYYQPKFLNPVAVHLPKYTEQKRQQYFAQKFQEQVPELNYIAKTLSEVRVYSQTKSRLQELDKRYANGLFQSGNSRTFNIIDDPMAATRMNVFEYLQGQIAGLQIIRTGAFNYSVSWRQSSTALFLDEMPMMNAADMSHISMSDVALIKVFNPPFMGGFGNGAGGAIAVYTRRGGDDLVRRGKGLETGSVVGYSVLKEFYSPDYATHHMMHEVSDVRSTLYWSPYILTDRDNKKLKIEFYNNDLSTSFKVVLEGINEEGKLTRLEKFIQ